mmetsp:Transcript_32671/g.104664  ORF Transcript_32671/g.104664 Transcript_32671/m.104664 type:complete len:221 (+) Transcript_32671:19-681(+)
MSNALAARQEMESAISSSKDGPLLRAICTSDVAAVAKNLALPKLDERLDTPKADTALTWAVRHGQTAVVEYLLKGGASVEATSGGGGGDGTPPGSSPLLIAAMRGRTECLSLLINAGADVSKPREADGWTPLFAAAVDDQPECVRLLLRAGAVDAGIGKLEMTGVMTGLIAAKLKRLAANGKTHSEVVQLLVESGAWGFWLKTRAGKIVLTKGGHARYRY